MEIIILIHLFLFQVPVQHQAVETAGHFFFLVMIQVVEHYHVEIDVISFA